MNYADNLLGYVNGEPVYDEPSVAPSSPTNHDHSYYNHPTIPGLQAYQVAQAFSYNVGTAMVYLWRAGRKPGNPAVDDLEKAINHIRFELERLRNE